MINLVINGVIAWFVFRDDQSVRLAGPDTIFKMLLPMSFIESTLTSFFGVLSGTQEIQKHSPQTIPIRWGRWFVFAVRYSVIRGVVAFCIFAAAMYGFHWAALDVSIPGHFVAMTVGLISGALAFVLHSAAVIHSEKFPESITTVQGR